MGSHVLEICVENLDGIRAAADGGAHRIELCAALGVGGLTPGAGTQIQARAMTTLPIMTMIRPRPGDFVYDDEELAAMESDITVARDLGADGVVFGVLTEDGAVDRGALDRLVAASEGLDITFHRAFDVATDPEAALDVLIAAGIPRLLTSGQAATAAEGITTLRTLVEQAADRIVIMPGCGLTSANIRTVADGSGARELHGSAAKTTLSDRAFEPERTNDADEIRRMRAALDS